MIPLSKPYFDALELDNLAQVLQSGRLVQGPRVEELERRLAALCNRPFAIAVSSGTSALQLALAALEVGPGDEVLCPALSWPSPVHAIALSGATPVLVDVDLQEWNAAPEHYSLKRTTRTKVAIVIDQFGNPARHQEIQAALPGITLLEDAACAIGSGTSHGPCGSFGVIACLSFHPRKVLTTGEGGMCLTHEPELAQKLRVLRNHGQSSPGNFVQASGNFRLNEMAAALGLAQTDKLKTMLEERRQLAQGYQTALPDLIWQKTPQGAQPNHQTMGALLPQSASSIQRDTLIDKLKHRGVEASRLSYAIHHLPSVVPFLKTPERLPNTETIVERGFALPLYNGMTLEAQSQVIQSVQAIRAEIFP